MWPTDTFFRGESSCLQAGNLRNGSVTWFARRITLNHKYVGSLPRHFQRSIQTQEGQTKAREETSQACGRSREADHGPFRDRRLEYSGKHRNENRRGSITPGISPWRSGLLKSVYFVITGLAVLSTRSLMISSGLVANNAVEGWRTANSKGGPLSDRCFFRFFTC